MVACRYTWDVDFNSPERLQKHRKKMTSKLTRPRKQMAALGKITEGKVWHINSATDIPNEHTFLGMSEAVLASQNRQVSEVTEADLTEIIYKTITML